MLRDKKGRFVKVIHGFKGFKRVWDEGLKAVVGKCLGKFYKSGETYEEDDARICHAGMHFCTDPIDVFRYYPPNEDCVYAPVTAPEKSLGSDVSPSGVSLNDSKRCTKSLTIGKRLMDLSEYCDYIENNHVDLGRREKSDKGHVYVHNSAKGFDVVQASHPCCIARNVDILNAAVVSGSNSVAITEKAYSIAAALSSDSRAIGKYDGSIALAVGDTSVAEARARGAVAIATGFDSMVKGAVGSYLIIADWRDVEDSWQRFGFVSAVVDGSIIKADTWYAAMDGKLVEAQLSNKN